MFNFASHLLALLITYFGVVSSVDKLKLNTYDSRKWDPSYSLKVEFNSGIKAIFQGYDDIPYDLLVKDPSPLSRWGLIPRFEGFEEVSEFLATEDKNSCDQKI